MYPSSMASLNSLSMTGRVAELVGQPARPSSWKYRLGQYAWLSPSWSLAMTAWPWLLRSGATTASLYFAANRLQWSASSAGSKMPCRAATCSPVSRSSTPRPFGSLAPSPENHFEAPSPGMPSLVSAQTTYSWPGTGGTHTTSYPYEPIGTTSYCGTSSIRSSTRDVSKKIMPLVMKHEIGSSGYSCTKS